MPIYFFAYRSNGIRVRDCDGKIFDDINGAIEHAAELARNNSSAADPYVDCEETRRIEIVDEFGLSRIVVSVGGL